MKNIRITTLLFILLQFQLPIFSQTITKLNGISHVSGFLNQSIVFCDTANPSINEETYEVTDPAFVIKNIANGKKNTLVHNSKVVASTKVSSKGGFLILKYAGEKYTQKYITQINEAGEINKTFGKDGFILLPNINDEELEYIDLEYDSLGNFYVLEERTLINGLMQAVVFKYLKNGNLDLSFAEKGILLSDKISNYSSSGMLSDRMSIGNKDLVVTCKNGEIGLVFTISENGKMIQKAEKALGDFMLLKNPNGKLNFVIKNNSVELFDKPLQNKVSVLDIKGNNMMTEVYYNRNNKKCYVVVDGLGDKVSKVYEIKNDNSAVLIFSADKNNEYASSKDDHITGVFFTKDEIQIALSVTESFEKYTYVNYLVKLK